MPDNIKVAIVDDHQLFRKGLLGLLDAYGNKYQVLFEATGGDDLMAKMLNKNLPDIVLMDINMPGMDGFECVSWLNVKYPQVKILIISMVEQEETIVKMLKLGVKGYLTKNVNPVELSVAIDAIADKGYYYTDFITGRVIHSIQKEKTNSHGNSDSVALNDREKIFLQFACSELTYQQIADKMFLSHKTIDGYRNALFEKLQVKTRTGLALFAVKNGLVTL